jgi:hypothetical protein
VTGPRLTGICEAAADGGRWERLHEDCPGPVAITVPGQGGGTIRLPCDCPCHRDQETPA